ncbi:MAG: hypothetical protein Q8R26_01185 [bacterium]|nr:hypothetical protein [bacterium]
MILIISRKDDPHADLVINELHRIKKDFFRINTDFFNEYEVSFSYDSGYIRNKITGRTVCIEEIGSIWLRRRSFPNDIKNSPEYLHSFLESEWTSFSRNLWSLLDSKFWISHPFAIDSAKDKARQLRIAKEIGFCVPKTIFTNSSRNVMTLLDKHKKCIYKPHNCGPIAPNSDKTIFTNVISKQSLSDPSINKELMICPGIFQEYIEKKYELRITVVGEKVFATKIDSQKSKKSSVDWRRYDFKNVPHSDFILPDSDKNLCIALTKKLGLQFGAIDAIITPEEKLIFLEINANGQWAWIQLLTHQPIAAAIAELLVLKDDI